MGRRLIYPVCDICQHYVKFRSRYNPGGLRYDPRIASGEPKKQGFFHDVCIAYVKQIKIQKEEAAKRRNSLLMSGLSFSTSDDRGTMPGNNSRC